jgi:hypothetical protein
MEEAVTVLESDNYFFLLGNDHKNIHVIDRETGTLVKELGYGTCPEPNFSWPHDMAWLVPGETLVVSNDHSICDGIMHVIDVTDVQNATITTAFGDDTGLDIATGPAIGPDGDLYISSWASHDVEVFDSETFSWIKTFIDVNSWGDITRNTVHKFEFRPDGYLYASVWYVGIVRFDAATGDAVDLWLPRIASGEPGAFLDMPLGKEWMDIPARLLYPEEE